MKKKSGLSDDLNAKAFTLIELLVVVLIIGILAAVAVPQYQKAVEKSRGVQALALLKSLGQAATNYHMANGGPATSFDVLDVEAPNWAGTQKGWNHITLKDTRSNGEWSLQLFSDSTQNIMYFLMLRLSGKYKGGGFIYFVGSSPYFQENTYYCVEMAETTPFAGTNGDYCVKLFKGTFMPLGYTSRRNYTIPL